VTDITSGLVTDVTSSHITSVTSLPVAPHCSPSNATLSVPIYYSYVLTTRKSGNIDVPDEMLNVAMNINNPTILMEILSNKLLNAAIISEALWYGCHRESIVQFIIFSYVLNFYLLISVFLIDFYNGCHNLITNVGGADL
jgi:hypothetical protein